MLELSALDCQPDKTRWNLRRFAVPMIASGLDYDHRAAHL